MKDLLSLVYPKILKSTQRTFPLSPKRVLDDQFTRGIRCLAVHYFGTLVSFFS